MAERREQCMIEFFAVNLASGEHARQEILDGAVKVVSQWTTPFGTGYEVECAVRDCSATVAVDFDKESNASQEMRIPPSKVGLTACTDIIWKDLPFETTQKQ